MKGVDGRRRFKCGRCGAHVRFVDLRLLGCTKCGGDNGSSDYGVLEAKYGRGQKRLNGVIQ